MQIQILRKDGYLDYVSTKQLDKLIKEGKVICFRRTKELVSVKKDPIRNSKNKQYIEVERRKNQ